MGKDFDTCGHCCKWCGDMDGKSPATVRDTYPRMMRKVLGHEFHMGKKAAKEFIQYACDCNWDRIHETGAEGMLKAEDYAEFLVDEVWYFSDRWSWDRVLRAQWAYKRLCDRVWRTGLWEDAHDH